MTLHGDTRIDNYYWLRDDERARPDVLEYLHAENAYGKQVMDSQLSLQERLLKEIIDRIPQREVSAPYSKNGFRYRQVYEPGCEYAIYQRQSVLKEEWDEWEILLDANPVSYTHLNHRRMFSPCAVFPLQTEGKAFGKQVNTVQCSVRKLQI